MGGSFYSGWLIPREMSLVIWGIEREKDQKVKAQKVKVGFPPSQITAKRDSQMKVFH
jgi:hypothetical protein